MPPLTLLPDVYVLFCFAVEGSGGYWGELMWTLGGHAERLPAHLRACQTWDSELAGISWVPCAPRLHTTLQVILPVSGQASFPHKGTFHGVKWQRLLHNYLVS